LNYQSSDLLFNIHPSVPTSYLTIVEPNLSIKRLGRTNSNTLYAKDQGNNLIDLKKKRKIMFLHLRQIV